MELRIPNRRSLSVDDGDQGGASAAAWGSREAVSTSGTASKNIASSAATTANGMDSAARHMAVRAARGARQRLHGSSLPIRETFRDDYPGELEAITSSGGSSGVACASASGQKRRPMGAKFSNEGEEETKRSNRHAAGRTVSRSGCAAAVPQELLPVAHACQRHVFHRMEGQRPQAILGAQQGRHARAHSEARSCSSRVRKRSSAAPQYSGCRPSRSRRSPHVRPCATGPRRGPAKRRPCGHTRVKVLGCSSCSPWGLMLPL